MSSERTGVFTKENLDTLLKELVKEYFCGTQHDTRYFDIALELAQYVTTGEDNR